MKRGDLWRDLDQTDHSALPELDDSDVVLLWAMYRYDGPLNGMAEYRGRRVWFDFHHMDEDGVRYFYTLYPLTDAQVAEAEVWHKTKGVYERGEWVGRDEHVHDAKWNGPTFAGVTPLGWFKDGRNPQFSGIRIRD